MNRAACIILLSFLILSFPFLARYTFVQHNQYEQIPLILRFLDLNFLKNDWVTDLNFSFSPRIFFVVYIGTLAKLISLPLAYLVNFLIYTSLTVISTYLFSLQLFKSKNISLLTTTIILYGQMITLGNTNILGRDLDPPRLAISLVILGFALLLIKKYYIASILFALATYIQPLIGFEVPFVFYLSLLADYFFKRNRFLSQLHLIVKSFILYLGLSTFSILVYIWSFLRQNQTFSQNSVFTIISKVASPFHYSPSYFPLADYLKFLILFTFFIISYIYLKRRKNSAILHPIKYVVIIISLFCFMGYFFVEIIPSYYILLAQFFRLTIILYWIFAVITVGTCFKLIEENEQKKIPSHNLLLFIPAVISNTDYIGSNFLKGAVYVLFMFFVLNLIVRSKNILLKFPVFITLFLILSIPYRHFQFNYSRFYPFITPETTISLWVKDNMNNQKGIYLVPPDFFRFRLVSQKAIIVDRLVLPFSNEGILDWMKRIKDISGLNEMPDEKIDEQAIYGGYKKINMARINYLKTKYKFDFVIVENATWLPLEIVHKDGFYTIYKS